MADGTSLQQGAPPGLLAPLGAQQPDPSLSYGDPVAALRQQVEAMLPYMNSPAEMQKLQQWYQQQLQQLGVTGQAMGGPTGPPAVPSAIGGPPGAAPSPGVMGVMGGGGAGVPPPGSLPGGMVPPIPAYGGLSGTLPTYEYMNPSTRKKRRQ